MQKFLQFCLASFLLVSTMSASGTTLSNMPIGALNAAEPNLIFILDDSGSMDWEILLNTSSGALWWDSSVKSFTDASGNFLFNSNGGTGNNGTHTWYEYGYLFPNGTASDARHFTDGTYSVFAVPPTPAYAFLRSHDYNPIYYNSATNYVPWAPAYYGGATHTFSNATPTAARSHPTIPNSGSATTIDLTANAFSNASNYTFRMYPGMVIPGATMAGTQGRKNGSGGYNAVTTNYTIPTGEYWDVAFTYFPATFYVKDPSCTSGATCFTAPDGSALRQYQIKPGNTFPSGRTYAAELQNFANWYTYYRKHALMMASAMNGVIPYLSSIRGGIFTLNNRTPVTMYDFNSTTPSTNSQVILGVVDNNPATGGTPTRVGLNYAGQQYMTNHNIIQYGCQVNGAMIMTDGYADTTAATPPSYTAATWVGAAPYTQIFPTTLADIASSYYTNNLRPDLPVGLVPIDPNNTSPSNDLNPNLHMNTYGVSLAVQGTIYGTANVSAQNPYANPPTWPNPNVSYNPTAVDDLWHATINSRGVMTAALDVIQVIISIENIISNSLMKFGSGASLSVSSVNLQTGNNTAFMSSYTSNYGNLQAIAVNLTTGVPNVGSPLWDAQTQNDGLLPANRILATSNGNNTGLPFQWASLPAAMQTQLNSSINPPGPSDGQTVLNWLRGDKSLEAVNYRVRAHLLGDYVDAQPVYVAGAVGSYTDTGYAAFSASIANRQTVVYQGGNDGFLHAFNATNGNEMWAYAPSFVFPNLAKLASLIYSHQFYVDGTPVYGDAYFNSAWHTLLLGGLRAGGKGYYAIDITNPAVASESALASLLLWEFPNASTPTATTNNVGYSYGQPILVKTVAAGWVVLVSSGYNNGTPGDGKGHLYVLNPQNGQVIADLPTTSGSGAAPSGLAQISAFSTNGTAYPQIDYVYGGDLNGNVWRFDLSGASTAAWNVQLLATLVDSGGTAQPITTAPELSMIQGRRMVYVGTGQLLGASDLSTTQTQTMYALVDNGTSNPTISPLRSQLVGRALSGGTIAGTVINYNTYKGFYFDLPNAAERVVVNPVLAFGAIIFNTDLPSATACVATSYQYVIDNVNGLAIPGMGGTPYAVQQTITGGFASAPLIVVLPNGQVKSITHAGNNTVQTFTAPAASPNAVNKVSWREIMR